MTSHTIDLSNWVIEGLGLGTASVTIPSGSIAANGFFLISNFNKATSRINVDSDFVTISVSLVDTGELLTLKNNFGTTIDIANQASGGWFAGETTTPKKSMERKDPPDDGTSNGKWKNASTHTNMDGSSSTDEFGTPRAANPI